ncbi:MAG: ribosome recycling factor [SAR202 cluster bacterium]|nr:ribosome recycling factor [Chloroflexota bacterium]MQG22614.1 ribosome recycling factor [SAR202 cluster bacterium]|tara:strand:- start:939 stop:1502 length:564 start_codon:yes stop_codon:yes gene_type:complete
MTSIDETLKSTTDRMDKSVDALKRELSSVRTGRASSGLVENIKVECYGTTTPLNQLSSINIPEARTILIEPWDKSILEDIEKSILKSDIGLNPTNDGTLIRINIPPLTEERRKEMVKLVGNIVEQSYVAIRNIRRDSLETFRTLEKNKEISQDESRKAQEELQKLTEYKSKSIDEIKVQKETDVMEI